MESPEKPIIAKAVAAGIIHGLDIASQTLYEFARRIKDDQTRGFSERRAIVEVLNEIHKEFVAEMEKANGNADQSAGVSGDSQEREQASDGSV
jgi:hypothetical protein